MIDIRIMEAFAVHHGGRRYVPTAGKMKQVLALLALRANHIVPVEVLVEELWADNPPPSYATTTQTYVYTLRKAFKDVLGIENPQDVLVTVTPGYKLVLEDADRVDALEFERLALRGIRQVDDHDPEGAATIDSALALLHGEPMTDVTKGLILCGEAARLGELRASAVDAQIRTDLHRGRFSALVFTLRSLVHANPYNERLYAYLMHSLSECGRRGEALQVFSDARRVLVEELGIEPSPMLSGIQNDILDGSQTRIPGMPAFA